MKATVSMGGLITLLVKSPNTFDAMLIDDKAIPKMRAKGETHDPRVAIDPECVDLDASASPDEIVGVPGGKAIAIWHLEKDWIEFKTEGTPVKRSPSIHHLAMLERAEPVKGKLRGNMVADRFSGPITAVAPIDHGALTAFVDDPYAKWKYVDEPRPLSGRLVWIIDDTTELTLRPNKPGTPRAIVFRDMPEVAVQITNYPRKVSMRNMDHHFCAHYELTDTETRWEDRVIPMRAVADDEVVAFSPPTGVPCKIGGVKTP